MEAPSLSGTPLKYHRRVNGGVPFIATLNEAVDPMHWLASCGCKVISGQSATITSAMSFVIEPQALLTTTLYLPESLGCAFAIVSTVVREPRIRPPSTIFVPLNCH